MDLETQEHLPTLRRLLNFRLTELRADVHAAASIRRASLEGGEHEIADRKEEAAAHADAVVSDAQEQRDLDELALVEAALARLHSGTYGDCVDCQEPVGWRRLLAQPAAPRCAACAEDREHVLRRSAGPTRPASE